MNQDDSNLLPIVDVYLSTGEIYLNVAEINRFQDGERMLRIAANFVGDHPRHVIGINKRFIVKIVENREV